MTKVTPGRVSSYGRRPPEERLATTSGTETTERTGHARPSRWHPSARTDANAPVGQECVGEPAPWRPAGTAQSRHHASRAASGYARNRSVTGTRAPRRVEGEIDAETGAEHDHVQVPHPSPDCARNGSGRTTIDRPRAAKGIARQRTHDSRTEFRAATGGDPEGIGPRREAQILETQHCGSTTTQAPGISGWGASQGATRRP